MISAISTYVPIVKSVKPAIEIGLNFLSDQCSKRAQKWSCIVKNQEAERGRSNAYRKPNSMCHTWRLWFVSGFQFQKFTFSNPEGKRIKYIPPFILNPYILISQKGCKFHSNAV